MGTDQGMIYGLHAGDGVIRYVGLTRAGMTRRLARHRQSATRGSDFPVHCWMRKHGVESIVAVEIERCGSEQLPERERHWIAEIGRSGAKLLNATSGGEGVRDLSAESRAKISRAKSGENHPQFGKPAYIRGRKLPAPTPEALQRRSEGLRLAWAKKRALLAPGESFFGVTECPQGHEYTPENSGYGPGSNGYPVRYCKACRAAYKARKRKEAREQKVVFA